MIKENQKLLNKTLNEIEDLLWDDEFEFPGERVIYDDKTLGSAVKIFSHVLLSKLWEHQQNLPQRQQAALNAGKSIRQLVLDFTGIDLHKLYKGDNNG
jgi:hypothetical protein